jgi:hypothetical protein
VNLTVVSPPPPPISHLLANPTSLTETAGGAAVTTTLTATVDDANGNPVVGTGVVWSVTGLPSGASGSFAPAAETTDSSGVAATTLTVQSGTAVPGNYALEVSATEGSTQESTPVNLTVVSPPPPSATNSTLIASQPLVTAPGVSTSTLTVTVEDAAGNPVVGAGVTFSATGVLSGIATFSPAGVTTNSNGVATGTLTVTQSAQTETVTVHAFEAGGAVQETTPVTIGPGVPSTATSSLTASPTSVAADGGTSTLTVTVEDAAGNPVVGTFVTWVVTGSSASITEQAATTNSNGVATATLTAHSTRTETVTVTAEEGGAPTITQESTQVTLVGLSESAISDTAVTTGTDGKSYINAANFNGGVTTLTGTAEAGDTVSVSVNGGAAQAATVAANGAWSLAVSGLSDGESVTAVAIATDPAGNTASSPVYAFTVDTDAGEQTARKLTVNGGMLIGAATAGATPFTVQGIESDDNGTVSFSDGTHTPVVVNIVNGVLSATTANLGGLNDGTIKATLHLNNDAAGNSFTDLVTTATLDQDKIAETPTVTAPTARMVAAGGSIPLGIMINPGDSDDTISVKISGVPSFESVTAAGVTPTVTKQESTFTYTFNALPASDWNNGLILHSTYPGKGQPTNPLTVTVSNTTTGESSTAAPKTIKVTDPPASNTISNNEMESLGALTISNDAFASWNQIGGSDTHYSVVGVADFYGNGTDDILFRNTSTGDTWFEAISNGGPAGWNQIGGSDTNYSVVGTGDFYGNATDDILFRNNSTGDTWIEAISNGASNGWHQIGGSDTHYSVVGVGDFFGNGTDDILFRNNSTGDTWIEAISNGAFASWQQIGGSDTHYAVVAVGDYFGNGTSDILFQNNSTGDIWFEAISNGASDGWNQIGGSNRGYTVKT